MGTHSRSRPLSTSPTGLCAAEFVGPEMFDVGFEVVGIERLDAGQVLRASVRCCWTAATSSTDFAASATSAPG